MKFYVLIFTILGILGKTCPQIVQERLEELKSNESFLQQWRNHIKLWRDDFSNVDYGTHFDCSINNKTERATSVNELRPQDISIVAAMGSSIVAGMGAGADSLFSLLLEYRGLSYADGGDGDSTQMVTIPNILKNFNPDVFGQSYRVAPVWYERFSQLNVAVPGEKSENLKSQARTLVSRIENVPFSEHQWKLITINIGINDICQFCVTRRSYPSKWIKDIRKGLDYLYSHLSNTYVNLVSLPSVDLWQSFADNAVCSTFLRIECPCLENEHIHQQEQEFQALLKDLAKNYHRHDFTVEIQPFWQDISFQDENPSDNNTANNPLTYMAPDCFHLSQRGHAAAARALWNNMLQSNHNKTSEWNPHDTSILCPHQDCPYLRTRMNSIHCEYNKTVEEEESSEEPSESEEQNVSSEEDYDEEDSTKPHHHFTHHPHDWNSTRPDHHHATHHPHKTRPTRQPHTRATREHHTRATREHHTRATQEHHTREHHTHEAHNHTRHHVLTLQPSGLVTSSDGIQILNKLLAQNEPHSSSALPWVIAGILGTLVVALVAMLVVQHRLQNKKQEKRLLTERSPLLGDEAKEQIY